MIIPRLLHPVLGCPTLCIVPLELPLRFQAQLTAPRIEVEPERAGGNGCAVLRPRFDRAPEDTIAVYGWVQASGPGVTGCVTCVFAMRETCSPGPAAVHFDVSSAFEAVAVVDLAGLLAQVVAAHDLAHVGLRFGGSIALVVSLEI